MRIETSKTSQALEADLVLELAGEGSLMIQLKGDGRRPGEIADDFDRTEWIRTEDGGSYTAFTDLRVFCRLDPETVQLRLFREE